MKLFKTKIYQVYLWAQTWSHISSFYITLDTFYSEVQIIIAEIRVRYFIIHNAFKLKIYGNGKKGIQQVVKTAASN